MTLLQHCEEKFGEEILWLLFDQFDASIDYKQSFLLPKHSRARSTCERARKEAAEIDRSRAVNKCIKAY